MNDRDFLRWVYDRLIHQHKAHANADYMLKLDALIRATDPEKRTLP